MLPLDGETVTRLAELRALLAKATPGPWKVADCGYRLPMDGGRACGVVSEIERPTAWSSKPVPMDVMTSDARDECGHPVTKINASLIVAAVNALPELLDVAEAARKLHAEWRLERPEEMEAHLSLGDALEKLSTITDETTGGRER